PPADRSNRANARQKCRDFDPEADCTAAAPDRGRSRRGAPDYSQGHLRPDPSRAPPRRRSSPAPSPRPSDRPARVAPREGRAVVRGTTMSVSVRKYEDGKTKGYEVDVVARLPDGRTKRSRTRLAAATKDAAVRWGQQRLTELLLHRGTKPKEVPTLAEFETRFVQEFAVANRQKPSTIASKKTILKKYLVPQLGRKRLDEIKHEDVQRLKAKLVHLNPKTVNCVLTVLSKLLKVAVEWQVMEIQPVTVKRRRSP